MKIRLELTIALFLTLQFGYILASPIDKEIAKKVAISFMNSKVGSSMIVKNVIIEDLNGQISFYVVNFQTGGWVMVSADNSAVPVLSYSLYGEYKLEDEKPAAFTELTNSYKEQIANSKSFESSKIELSSKWETLISGNNHSTMKLYIPGDQLLDVHGRGHVQWRQGTNNSGGCTPSYNAFCPNKDCESNCDENALVGCGAVAMGQIMWYWQWPLSSSYRTYDWALMPPEILNTTPIPEGNEIANLLRDIGREDAADMFYWCVGTWTTVNKIEEAFKNKFNYKSAKKHVKEDWKYGSAWGDLLRSEIDNERPVFYRGDSRSDLFAKHFFVIDGYDEDDSDFFWFNFGHGGQPYNNSRHYLNDITPSSFDWTKNQMAVVGISPTYNEFAPNNVNIFDVPYSIVSNIISEEAQQDIVLPATGKELTIENGGELNLIAGNSITINPGFHAKPGSQFTAHINPDYANKMDISVPTWYNAFTPNGDGYNDELCFDVENANSWEFEAFDRNGTPIFQSAGTIADNNAYVWDGSGANCTETYACAIRFKNNYGRSLENKYMVMVICDLKTSKVSNDSITLRDAKSESLKTNTQNTNNEFLFTAYPNPTNGILNLRFSDLQEINLKIYNAQGIICFQNFNIKQTAYNIDMSAYANGIYVISVEVDNRVLTQKIILKK